MVVDFLRLNRLEEYRNQTYKPIADVPSEYPLIRGVLRHGDFPLKIIHGLRHILRTLGTHPLIVRSSSLLEDRIVGRRVCKTCGSAFHVQNAPPPEDGKCPSCGGPIVQRSDDTEETVKARLAVYHKDTAPLEDFYRQRSLLRTVEGSGSPDQVERRIQEVLAAKKVED